MDKVKVCKKRKHHYPADLRQCPICHKMSVSIYRQNNKDKIKEIDKNYYLLNTERQKQNHKEWKKNNSGKMNALNNKRRAARIQATPKWLTKEHLKQIERYYLTAKWIQSILGIKIHVDHIVPLRNDKVCGLHVPWNLQLLTYIDNARKYNSFNN
jgi:hypothetical protein